MLFVLYCTASAEQTFWRAMAENVQCDVIFSLQVDTMRLPHNTEVPMVVQSQYNTYVSVYTYTLQSSQVTSTALTNCTQCVRTHDTLAMVNTVTIVVLYANDT